MIKPGMLIERTYGEGRRPVGIVIAGATTHHRGQWWIVEWAGNSKREIMNQQYLKQVS